MICCRLTVVVVDLTANSSAAIFPDCTARDVSTHLWFCNDVWRVQTPVQFATANMTLDQNMRQDVKNSMKAP